ncbi:hypothetical protein DdX_02345 [Ditylenchus destructor]|uniref:p-granule-associated protein DEPS-1 second OB-fold domain-containing protein n=1 Tax=Ditylenchus destructor TaxID=166010 RepID=A0AAD4R5Y2_9BILA|nr:hypothetical protein DdX_02345 [Ditylenchus destructor]
MLTFGNTPPDNARGNIGVIVASIYGPGEVANVVYYSNTKPLALVPRSYFVPKPEGIKGLTNSQIRKRTEIFKVEDNVEFEVDKKGIVQWIRKSPAFLDIYLCENKFLQKALGVVSPSTEGQSVLWVKGLGLVAASSEMLKQVEPNVTWTITIEIKISFGEHENSPSLFLDSFKPTYELELHSFESVEDNIGFVRQAPWMNDSNDEIQQGSLDQTLESEQTTVTNEDISGQNLVVDEQPETRENEPYDVKPSNVEHPSEHVVLNESGVSEILSNLEFLPNNSASVVEQLMSPELQEILENMGPGLCDRVAKMLSEEKHSPKP